MKKIIDTYLKSSIGRVGFLICIIGGNYCAIWGLMNDKDLLGLSALAGVILGAAFGGKHFGNKSEVKK